MGFRSAEPPVQVGDEIEVEIISVGAKGDGMCKVQNYVIFVPGTEAEQRVKIKITRALPKVGFADLVEVLGTTPSDAPDI